MLTLLRKIRKSLIESGSVRRYILYAIGEIALVVIGILIALQINNWNAQQKLRVQEIKMLRSFQKSLKSDLVDLQNKLDASKQIKSSTLILLEHLEQDKPYHDSLAYHFGATTMNWFLFISEAPFETLKSKGLDLISNDSLQQQIVDFYSTSNYFLKLWSEVYRDIITDASKSILDTRFHELWGGDFEKFKLDPIPQNFTYSMVPLDYEKLKSDQEYLFFLRSLKNQYFWYRERAVDVYPALVTNLIESVEDELAALENSGRN